MKTLWQDARYGLRMLWKSPGFTLVAVVSLALGIGANTAIFSVVNGILFRAPQRVASPGELVAVYTSDYSGPLYGSSSYPDFVDFRERSGEALSGLAAHTIRTLSLSEEGGEAERILGTLASANYFDVLGVRAARGRMFSAEDEAVNAPPVAVISHALWQSRFASDPAAVGRTVMIGGRPVTIIGVAPEGFTGMLMAIAPDVWIPISAHAQITNSAEQLGERGSRGLLLVGRLKAGISLPQAQASFDALAAGLRETHREQWTNVRGESRRITLSPEADARVPPQIRTAVFAIVGLLFAVVGLVLLIACANVANLLLARAAVRRKEIGIRIALGASRFRLVRQLLTESVMLAMIGGAFGLLIALWTVDLLMSLTPPTPVPLALNFRPDGRVLLFTLGLSALTGIVFGLAPALQATSPNVVPALRDDGMTAGRVHRRFSLRNMLVVAQVALSLILLIGAGLFLRSLQNAQNIETGFRTEGVFVMTPEIEIQNYDETRGREFYRQLVEQVESLPGVQSASLAEVVPLNLGSQRGNIQPEGYERRPGEEIEYDFNIVGARYFETIGIDLVLGRGFMAEDREGAPGVVIVNESFARRFFGVNANPLGRRLSRSGAEGPFLEIVGVARDAKYNTLGEGRLPFFYLPYAQNYRAPMTLHVRAADGANARPLIAAVRERVRALDRNLPVSDIKTLDEHINTALLLPRTGAALLGAFGLLALLLAAAGLFGVMSFSVARRTREIGIRMALGAQTTDVMRMVLREGMMLTIVGVALGAVAALALTRVLTSLLYGVSATDPITFIIVILLLIGVAALASYIPARRATKVDPMVALRYE